MTYIEENLKRLAFFLYYCFVWHESCHTTKKGNGWHLYTEIGLGTANTFYEFIGKIMTSYSHQQVIFVPFK